MSGGELDERAHVDNDDIAGGEPINVFGPVDLLELVAVAQVRGGQFVELSVMRGRDRTHSRPEFTDSRRGQSVVDPSPVTSGGHQSCGGEDPDMKPGVRDTLTDLGCQFIDVTLALGEYVDQLGAASVTERLGDLSERVEQRILSLPVTRFADVFAATD